MNGITLEGRNLSLNDAMALLTEQATHKVDVVLPYSAMKAEGGRIVIDGVEVVLNEEGVTDPNGHYRPTHVGDESIATRLAIPTPYMRRLREDDNIPLWDHNVNHWLGMQATKKAMVRLFAADNGVGVFRSMSSDRFKRMDHLDTVLAILDGLSKGGVDFTIGGFDISERRLRLTVEAPAIKVAADTLLKGYRSPFNGQAAADLPWVHAGFAFSNSETGNGSLSLSPRAVVEVCTNGMTRSVDLFRAVHLGGKMDEGVVKWAADTQEQSLRLVTAQVRDTVQAFCSEDYLAEWVGELEQKSGTPVADPGKAIKVIARKSGFSETEAQGILAHFISGGQATAGGFMHATTSFAQTIESPERAVEVEESGEKVLAIAAALSH